MNQIHFLGTNDFQTADTPSGSVLKNKVRGLSFVMFYSNQCKFCHIIMPFFKDLANKFPGTIFAMVNISNNLNLIHASKKTITPIKYVPLMIFYKYGMPIYKYEGQTDETSYKQLFEFLKEIHDSLSNTRAFHTTQAAPSAPPTPSIPPYLICKPFGDDPEGVCFLDLDNAYKK
jgi:thiol-disulfide isomerase/thioredoxin